MTCSRHPYAAQPVLCSSVAEQLKGIVVEDVEPPIHVYTDDHGEEIYSAWRTKLYCAEADAHGADGVWGNVKFYIVHNFKKAFNHNMVIPEIFEWAPPEKEKRRKK